MKIKYLFLPLITFMFLSSCVREKTAPREPPDANVLWEDDFNQLTLDDSFQKGWGNFNGEVSTEIVNSHIRLRETAAGNIGRLRRMVPIDRRAGNDYRFLQIKTGMTEQEQHCLTISFAGGDGACLGKPFAGITTFDLETQPFAGRTGKFPLILTIRGNNGKEAGGWLDVDWIRIVKTPVGGLTMTLLEKENRTAEVGDKILFNYYSKGTIGKDEGLLVKCYAVSGNNVAVYRFRADSSVKLNDEGKNGDEKAGDGVFSALVTIDPNAYKLTSEKTSNDSGAVTAWVKAEGEDVFAPSPFFMNVQTTNEIPKMLSAASPVVVNNRLLWLERIKGENIAIGRKVIFSQKPSYPPTASNTDENDLTDGKISKRSDDQIWFEPDAVGFVDTANTVEMMLDLGKTEPVDRIVMRLLGGNAVGVFRLPRAVDVLVSEDGTNFYKAATLAKLMPAEKEQANDPGVFFTDEAGKAFVYPLQADLKTKARFIGIHVTPDGRCVVADEIAVIKGDLPVEKISCDDGKKANFFFNGVVFGLRLKNLYISTNILTPNFFLSNDCRDEKDRKKAVEYVIETPRQVTIVNSNQFQREDVVENGREIHRYKFKTSNKSPFYFSYPLDHMRMPFYFKIKNDTPVSAGDKAVFYALAEGYKPNRVEVPIVPIEIPKVPKLKYTHVSLAWMQLSYARQWPDFFTAWEHLGFNAVACFPRDWSAEQTPGQQAFLEEVRKRGFKVIYNESPFHMMEFAAIKAKSDEVYSILANGPSRNLCPSYRGKFYQGEIRRVGDCFEKTRGDYVFYDIECWERGTKEAPDCKRCMERYKQNGGNKPFNDFLVDLGTEMLGDMRDEIKRRSEKLNIKMPVLGNYGASAALSLSHHGIMNNFRILYPGYIQLAMPSLYVAGNAQKVHDCIRQNYKTLNNRNIIIPWLSTGTYGEFNPEKTEDMVLESLLNGAGGITYYSFADFDTSLDFFHHAKALADIAPYERILVKGGMREITGTDKDYTYSAWKTDKEILILAGNYKSKKNPTIITLPFKKVIRIVNLSRKKELPAGATLSAEVPPNRAELYYVAGE